MTTAMKHSTPTPGPWRVEEDSDVNDIDFATQEYRWPWRVIGPHDEVVVDFTGGNNVSEADARLISAAPDLLAALEGLLAEIGPDWPDEWSALAYEEAAAALRKVEGGQP